VTFQLKRKNLNMLNFKKIYLNGFDSYALLKQFQTFKLQYDLNFKDYKTP